MSQSTNKDKYDALLNKFLENDNVVEENESNEMERWLNEAANNIRSQFQNHRGNMLQKSEYKNNDEMLHNRTNHLAAAICVSLPSDSSDDEFSIKDKKVKKRQHESYPSDIKSPLKKRTTIDQSFLNDILGINTISLSAGLHCNLPPQSLGSISNDVTMKSNNMIGSSCFETNMVTSNISIHTPSYRNFDLVSEQPNGTNATSKFMSKNASVTSKTSDTSSSKDSHMNRNESFAPSQLMTTVNINSSNCIWPIGNSYQPDFVEIVVTDEEMNAYWDTLKDF